MPSHNMRIFFPVIFISHYFNRVNHDNYCHERLFLNLSNQKNQKILSCIHSPSFFITSEIDHQKYCRSRPYEAICHGSFFFNCRNSDTTIESDVKIIEPILIDGFLVFSSRHSDFFQINSNKIFLSECLGGGGGHDGREPPRGKRRKFAEEFPTAFHEKIFCYDNR